VISKAERTINLNQKQRY